MSNPELPIVIGSSNSARMPASLTSLQKPRNCGPPLENSTWKPVFMRGSRYTNVRMMSTALIPGPSYLSAANPILSVSPPDLIAGWSEEAQDSSAAADKPARGSSNGSNSSSILIVEDDVSLGKFLSRALKLKLFAVEVALDGEAAWEPEATGSRGTAPSRGGVQLSSHPSGTLPAGQTIAGRQPEWERSVPRR